MVCRAPSSIETTVTATEEKALQQKRSQASGDLGSLQGEQRSYLFSRPQGGLEKEGAVLDGTSSLLSPVTLRPGRGRARGESKFGAEGDQN